MKTLGTTLAAATLLALTACMPPGARRGGGGSMDILPTVLDAKTPDLGIAPEAKLPLKVAVVVPDPMAYTIVYDLPGFYNRDFTAEYRKSGLQLESELSKVASQTLSQAFAQVVVVRELPPPGTYDAVVRMNFGKILLLGRMVNRFTGRLACDVTGEWSLAAFDGQNRDLLGKKGVAAPGSFEWGAMSAHKDFARELGPVLSRMIGDLAKEWGTTLHQDPGIAAQAKTAKKS